MMRKLALLSALLIPASVLALTIEAGDFYNDVRPDSPEAAGINLLTRENVLQGYGQGIFGGSRTVNRAEFLKIAILSTPENRRPLTKAGVSCFPDVPAEVWFAPSVCAAKSAGIVKGNPDGLFHPERTVQYDEALKILSILFGYDIHVVDSQDWGEPYYNAAVAHGTDLPIRITFSTLLTRSLSARLAAAYLAETEGQLAAFRLAEHNEYASSSSSSSVSSAVSSVPSSSAAVLFTLPTASHFLITGQASDAIADGRIRSVGETAKVSLAEVKLVSEVRSIERLELVTTDGTVITTLTRKITTDTPDYKETFTASILPKDRFLIPADTDFHVVLRAVIRTDANAGFSEELLQVKSFSVTLLGETSNQSFNIPVAGPYPKHQTSFGRITSITRVSPVSAPMVAGSNLLIGSYAFSGSVITGKSISLSTLTFSIYKTGTLSLANVALVRPLDGARANCSVNEQAKTIFCPLLSATVGSFPQAGPLILNVRGDITLASGPENASLEASLNLPGSPESLGAVEWTDASGMFRWIEHGVTPIVHGTRFQ